MPTYIYETIPQNEEEAPVRFEFKQSMNDEPLTCHPESGAPVKRVISGGYGFSIAGGGKSAAAPAPASCCSGGGCGCSHN